MFANGNCLIFATRIGETQMRHTLRNRIRQRIGKSPRKVFLREDFLDIKPDYDQVGRALATLVKDGALIKLGYGLYAKAVRSRISGKLLPASPLPDVGREALKRLHVQPLPTRAETAHDEGRSTQVPTGRVVGVRSRISRRIGHDGVYLAYERV